MLYYLSLLTEHFSPLRVFRYITVRTVAGAGTAFLICVVLGPVAIRSLRALRIRERGRTAEDSPLFEGEAYGAKEGTPTMGGLLVLAAMLVACFLWTKPTSFYVQISLATMCIMGLIGFWDDYAKLRGPQSKGLSARMKFGLQMVWAIVVVGALLHNPDTSARARQLMVPFMKTPLWADIGILGTFIFVIAVLVGATNAVNLTDGLDGLAIGCTSSVALSFLVMSYAAGHVAFAEYLMIPYVSGGGELAVFCGCLAGACLGFLWHNCHPAAVFMGDTGSLALGGAIAIVAILIKQELVLFIVGGVLVMEAGSVILQVASFKLRGKRIFKMSPIHHHFQLKGWTETQITIRFWILSIIFALLGLLTLKIR